jgi:hypothetical protein
MPLAHDTDNYLYGKGRLYFKPEDGSGYLDLGNIPKFGIEVEVEKNEHFSSRSGTRDKDLSIVLEKSAKASLTLEEASAENLNIGFMGDGVVSGSQSAGQIDADETTTVSDQFIDLGKTDLSITKITHGSITGGPFQAGETITGGTSGTTAKVAWMATGDLYLEVINASGDFTVGEEITGGTSAATADVSGTEEMEDVVVADAETATTRYVAGTDYTVDVVGGLLRELSGGSIAASTCYVSCDYAATTTKSIRGLKNSESRGELLFIGDPDQGPKWRVQVWDVNLVISGEGEFISEEILTIPMEAEFFKAETAHPSEPFFRATEIS